MRCNSKVSHATRKAAITAARKTHPPLETDGTRTFNVYKCKHCTGWHIGKRREYLIKLIDYAVKKKPKEVQRNGRKKEFQM